MGLRRRGGVRNVANDTYVELIRRHLKPVARTWIAWKDPLERRRGLASMTRGKRFIGAAVLAAAVGGCATSVPDLQGPGVSEQTEISREAHLISHIKCELRHAITLVERQDATTTGGNSTSWLDGWGAKISLKVQVDETGALAPNVTLTKPLRNVIRSFPGCGNVTTSQSGRRSMA